MSLIRMLRALWLPDLGTVTGHVQAGLRDWITDQTYQISHNIQGGKFVLDVTAARPLLNAFAADINRMAAASFETALGLQKHPFFPRSNGWVIIQSYYAAFFAAHAFLRMFGISISQFDSAQAISIDRVAKAYGIAAAKRTAQGAYICKFDTLKSRLSCELVSETGGVHQIFWGRFASAIDTLSSTVLTINTETSSNKQTVSERLLKLIDNLRYGPYSNASWLSQVRNAVNYRQELGCWYPFHYEKSAYSNLHDHSRTWLVDPLRIDLTVSAAGDLKAFLNTCQFIVSLCRELTEELAARTSGKSFTIYRPLVVLNLATQIRMARRS